MDSRIDLKRGFLAALTAAAVAFALVLVAGGLPASAVHIAATGPVGDNCVEFQVDATGTKSPKDFPDVDIALNSWDPDDIGFTFTVSDGTVIDGRFSRRCNRMRRLEAFLLKKPARDGGNQRAVES